MDEAAWSPAYGGKYTPVLWDASLAIKLRLNASACSTVEEAVRRGDQRGFWRGSAPSRADGVEDGRPDLCSCGRPVGIQGVLLRMRQEGGPSLQPPGPHTRGVEEGGRPC